MDPDAPLKHQLYLKLTAGISLLEDLDFWLGYSQDVHNDFTTKRRSDSALPRVRSEVNRYLTQGESGFDYVYLEWRRSVTPEVHLRGYGGLLEQMFAGVGSEVLWESFGSRLAFGANLNWVQQRAYEKNFSLRDYQTLTGHFSIFYASPWNNLDFGIHVGRFLAGDRGVTYEARRTFDNGFAIGAFFTKTNVSAAEFGEGSFDKGLYLKLPFNFFTRGNSRDSYKTIIRPTERDGGRRLEGFAGELWWDRRSVRFDSLWRQKGLMQL